MILNAGNGKLKIDTPTKKTLLGINLHIPIWLLFQLTSIDWLKPVLTTGPVNTIDRFFANPATKTNKITIFNICIYILHRLIK